MQGYKIVCTASSYSDREVTATKGWWVEVAASDPLVAKLKSNPAFKLTPTEVPDVFVPPSSTDSKKETSGKPPENKSTGNQKPPEGDPPTGEGGDAKTGTKTDDIANVPDIAAPLLDGMKAAGFDTVEKVCAAGIDGLTKIKGIGVPTATQILLACSEYLGDA